MEQRINKIFHQNVETTMEVTETLTAGISLVAQRLANTLLNEGKIIVAGNGICGALGQIFVSSLVNRLHHERPGLPAFSLQADSVALSAVAEQNGMKEAYSKQLRALANNSDLLFIIALDESVKNIDHLILTAQDKNIPVVVLCVQNNDILQEKLLCKDDLSLALPLYSKAASYQAQLQILLALTDLIDFQLFGVGETL